MKTEGRLLLYKKPKPVNTAASKLKKEIDFFEKTKESTLPGVIQYYGHNPHSFYLVEELIQGNDVYTVLNTWNESLPESIIKFFFMEIFTTCLQLHGLNIAHLRLFPEHIMVSEDYKVKVISFSGWEHLNPRNKKQDFYKLGALLFSLYTKKPFPDNLPPSRLNDYIRRLKCEKMFPSDEPLKMISCLIDQNGETPTKSHSYLSSGATLDASEIKKCFEQMASGIEYHLSSLGDCSSPGEQMRKRAISSAGNFHQYRSIGSREQKDSRLFYSEKVQKKYDLEEVEYKHRRHFLKSQVPNYQVTNHSTEFRVNC